MRLIATILSPAHSIVRVRLRLVRMLARWKITILLVMLRPARLRRVMLLMLVMRVGLLLLVVMLTLVVMRLLIVWRVWLLMLMARGRVALTMVGRVDLLMIMARRREMALLLMALLRLLLLVMEILVLFGHVTFVLMSASSWSAVPLMILTRNWRGDLP